jgi:hypothetical protein
VTVVDSESTTGENIVLQMTYQFEIEKVFWHHNRGNFIVARHLGDKHDFSIPDGSFLGTAEVDNYTETLPIKDEQGLRRMEMFVFRTFSVARLDEKVFAEGRHVTLTVAE